MFPLHARIASLAGVLAAALGCSVERFVSIFNADGRGEKCRRLRVTARGYCRAVLEPSSGPLTPVKPLYRRAVRVSKGDKERLRFGLLFPSFTRRGNC